MSTKQILFDTNPVIVSLKKAFQLNVFGLKPDTKYLFIFTHLDDGAIGVDAWSSLDEIDSNTLDFYLTACSSIQIVLL
jgi:hypothetical protein